MTDRDRGRGRDERVDGGVRFIFPEDLSNDGVTVGTNRADPRDPYDYDRDYYRGFAETDLYGYGYATDRGYYGPNVESGRSVIATMPTTGEPTGNERRGPHYGKGPRGYRRSDERIAEEVHQALSDHPHLDATDIEVTVRDGEVTLSGRAPDRESRRLAEDVVLEVRGVVDVHNRIRRDRS
ncbi:BON domain-containing protein [Deinococcus pimensis]|uniref:BON domain-containing protein n=1 Tax=Deinococcus pimensis TaxID=309888 RepID=UPI000480B7DE|nr:BON domain-containing protein [Deinococcus pimensis]